MFHCKIQITVTDMRIVQIITSISIIISILYYGICEELERHYHQLLSFKFCYWLFVCKMLFPLYPLIIFFIRLGKSSVILSCSHSTLVGFFVFFRVTRWSLKGLIIWQILFCLFVVMRYERSCLIIFMKERKDVCFFLKKKFFIVLFENVL